MEKQKQQASKTVKGLFAYPNKPFNGKLNIRFDAPEKGNVSIAVTDVNGKEIATEQLKDFQGVYLGQIDLKNLAQVCISSELAKAATVPFAELKSIKFYSIRLRFENRKGQEFLTFFFLFDAHVEQRKSIHVCSKID